MRLPVPMPTNLESSARAGAAPSASRGKRRSHGTPALPRHPRLLGPDGVAGHVPHHLAVHDPLELEAHAVGCGWRRDAWSS